MKSYRVILLLFICALSMPSCSANGQDASKAREASCHDSVQKFYDWYVANVHGEQNDWHIALEKRGWLFSRDLTESLNNSDRESKAYGDPVLDFDPILATQDMGDHYVVRKVRIRNNQCYADVYGVWSRPVSGLGKGPQVVAELIFENGRWQFVNFQYPGSNGAPTVDLMKILRSHQGQ